MGTASRTGPRISDPAFRARHAARAQPPCGFSPIQASQPARYFAVPPPRPAGLIVDHRMVTPAMTRGHGRSTSLPNTSLLRVPSHQWVNTDGSVGAAAAMAAGVEQGQSQGSVATAFSPGPSPTTRRTVRHGHTKEPLEHHQVSVALQVSVTCY